MQGDGPDDVGRSGLLAIGRRAPDHLVQADEVDGSSAGEERIAGLEQGPGSDERPGAEGGVELVAAEGQEVRGGRQRAVRGQLGTVHQHRHPPGVGRGDDLVERWQPSGHVGRAGDRQQCGGSPAGVEGVDDVGRGERPPEAALDVATLGHPAPGQEIGVVLDDRGHHHVGGVEAQPVGELIDGLGGVAAQDGHVGPVRVAAGERQDGPAGLLVGRGGPTGPEAGSAVDTRIPGEEVRHALGHQGMGLGGGGLVQLDGHALDAVQAGDELAGSDEPGEGGGGIVGAAAGAGKPPSTRAS